ncbi:MAG UNVERIFIED_CONTAM: hypothetical protein LVQ98_02860 [Rickettsiaceae bacterium]|jgi:ankyrin repeat protein
MIRIAHPQNRAEFAEFVLKKYPGILMESMYDGDTAAHVCCYSPKPNFPLMQVLLKSEELDINPRNKSGQTPLDILLSNITNNTGNWSNILETFVAMVLYRPKIPDVIQVPKIRELLNKMNTKKQKKTLTETPQKVEEASAAPALTKLYISDANKAVLVDRVDESGMTAMHAACLLPREKIHNIMLELLRIGCNQFDALFEGQTVLDMMLASVSNPEDLDPEIQG